MHPEERRVKDDTGDKPRHSAFRPASGQERRAFDLHFFVASKAGGKAAAISYTLIETAKLNALDPFRATGWHRSTSLW